jgi:hypothetical protein
MEPTKGNIAAGRTFVIAVISLSHGQVSKENARNLG